MSSKINLEFNTETITESQGTKTGIYKITNLKNKKFYIGSVRGTSTFRNRFVQHQREFYHGINDNKHAPTPILDKAFKKYGLNNFKLEIIEEITDTDINILAKEEYYIKTLNPAYNVCQTCVNYGAPNKNRKLSQEGKNKIREKSKLYKHSFETLQKVTKNNKQNACKIYLNNDTEELIFNSGVELAKYFNIDASSYAQKCFNIGKKYKGYTIKKLSQQKKKIELLINNQGITFDSFNSCDKYLNKGRGYTSTLVTRNVSKLNDIYDYRLI